jgi:hypothetical protein
LIEHDYIRVMEDDDDPGLITFADSSLPVLTWLETGGYDGEKSEVYGWQLTYLDVNGEVRDHRIAGEREAVDHAVGQARNHLDGPHSSVFPTEGD